MLLDKYGHLKLADFGTCMRMGQVIYIFMNNTRKYSFYYYFIFVNSS